jgi:hypothetical protein
MSAYDHQSITEHLMDGYEEEDDFEECEECTIREATMGYEGMALCYGCYRWIVYGTS